LNSARRGGPPRRRAPSLHFPGLSAGARDASAFRRFAFSRRRPRGGGKKPNPKQKTTMNNTALKVWTALARLLVVAAAVTAVFAINARAQGADFVTSGGWITGTPSGANGNFAASGSINADGTFWGQLNYLDRNTGMHVVSTGVTAYAVDTIDPDCRIITYNVKIDGAPGTAIVRVCDHGEPGLTDTFEITLSDGYHAVGDLGGSRPGGGNVQLHLVTTG
jgi:hypothetical protein